MVKASSTERALASYVASTTPQSPKHGHHAAKRIHGIARAIDVKYPDDAALAAPFLLERLPELIGHCKVLLNWAQQVNDGYPNDIPTYGARLWDKG